MQAVLLPVFIIIDNRLQNTSRELQKYTINIKVYCSKTISINIYRKIKINAFFPPLHLNVGLEYLYNHQQLTLMSTLNQHFVLLKLTNKKKYSNSNQTELFHPILLWITEENPEQSNYKKTRILIKKISNPGFRIIADASLDAVINKTRYLVYRNKIFAFKCAFDIILQLVNIQLTSDGFVPNKPILQRILFFLHLRSFVSLTRTDKALWSIGVRGYGPGLQADNHLMTETKDPLRLLSGWGLNPGPPDERLLR